MTAAEPQPMTLWGARCEACCRLYPAALIDLDTRLCEACSGELALDVEAALLEPPGRP